MVLTEYYLFCALIRWMISINVTSSYKKRIEYEYEYLYTEMCLCNRHLYFEM